MAIKRYHYRPITAPVLVQTVAYDPAGGQWMPVTSPAQPPRGRGAYGRSVVAAQIFDPQHLTWLPDAAIRPATAERRLAITTVVDPTTPAMPTTFDPATGFPWPTQPPAARLPARPITPLTRGRTSVMMMPMFDPAALTWLPSTNRRPVLPVQRTGGISIVGPLLPGPPEIPFDPSLMTWTPSIVPLARTVRPNFIARGPVVLEVYDPSAFPWPLPARRARPVPPVPQPTITAAPVLVPPVAGPPFDPADGFPWPTQPVPIIARTPTRVVTAVEPLRPIQSLPTGSGGAVSNLLLEDGTDLLLEDGTLLLLEDSGTGGGGGGLITYLYQLIFRRRRMR